MIKCWKPSSIVAYRAFPLISHYSASKSAVRGLTQAFALEVATNGITCNAYAPGIVGTAMCGEMDEAMGRMLGAAKGETTKKNSEESGQAKDVVETFSYLSGKRSDYMTEQTCKLFMEPPVAYRAH